MEYIQKEYSFYNDFIEPNIPKTKKEWIWFISIIVLVVLIGLIGLNQYLGLVHKATLIQDPCSLCESYIKNMRNPYQINISNFQNITLKP